MDDPLGLTVSVSVRGHDAVVCASGELDLATAPELEAALEKATPPAGGRVILDLRELSFSDAVGLRVIERASHRLGPRLMVVGPTPPVRRVFKVTELDQLLQLDDDDEAPTSDVPASNVAYVRQLWQAFSKGGVGRLAEIVPPDAEWEPLDGDRRAVSDGLAEFWRSDVDPTSFAAVGGDVLVSWQADGPAPTEGWSLYRFEGRRLMGASSFESREEALAAHRGDASS
jgi:anti-anti-sigma factor